MSTVLFLLIFVLCYSTFSHSQVLIPIEVHPASSAWWIGLKMMGNSNVMGVDISDTTNWMAMNYRDGIACFLLLFYLITIDGILNKKINS